MIIPPRTYKIACFAGNFLILHNPNLRKLKIAWAVLKIFILFSMLSINYYNRLYATFLDSLVEE